VKKLSDKMVINNLTLRNRLVMPALTTNAAAEGGLVTEAVMDFYRNRSSAVSLVIVEAAAVRHDGRLVPDSIGLWSDQQLPGMRNLAEMIKSEGAAAAVQLNHAGARCVPQPGPLAGASPSGFQFRSDVQPLVLSEAQIEELIDDFAAAAGRAVAAGFDGVEIHGAHFYLLSQFVSPHTNQREDQYGGGIAGRAAFPLAVVAAVRNKIGPDRAIIYRLNAVEQMLGYEVTEDTKAFSRMLAEAGVDLLDVSFTGPAVRQELDDGSWQILTSSALTRDGKFGANIEHPASLRKASGLPVIAVGKMADREVVASVLEQDQTDLIAVGRQMIADPQAAAKMLAGKYEEINKCKECFNCFSTIRRGEQMRCVFWD
jgi:NADPH2 dehydrogenase